MNILEDGLGKIVYGSAVKPFQKIEAVAGLPVDVIVLGVSIELVYLAPVFDVACCAKAPTSVENCAEMVLKLISAIAIF